MCFLVGLHMGCWVIHMATHLQAASLQGTNREICVSCACCKATCWILLSTGLLPWLSQQHPVARKPLSPYGLQATRGLELLTIGMQIKPSI